ncbi:putative six-hairpin glycosidase [Phaeomoniella chlamydospora]|uniref:Putative six-hairpin glycosidase n=1 Tax=Phaeomoniella chlamydospora TaxID=158046 RepID=A0A0G2E727_PHACM|nr:putative six-hairpin glycosidase [Phaeomoniella chlamydospora]
MCTTIAQPLSKGHLHLKYIHEGNGWIFTEFIHPVSWASKYQTIPDSAAHQVLETRWLRDPNYAKDVIDAYTRGGVEAQSGITYTHYMHRAILEHAGTTGDKAFLLSQLDGMIQTYDFWNVTIDSTTGLYHRTPLSDAQEYSLPGYLTGGPDGGRMQSWTDPNNDYTVIWLGPETYRPNFNAYMVAGARAISEVASLTGDTALAMSWNTTASSLYSKMEDMLYSNDINFWIDVVEGSNLDCVGRELIGYFPFRFDVGTSRHMIQGLEAGLDSEGFITEYGPTTLEQRNPYYTPWKNTTYCCQGQSWPFSTSIYLGTLAKLARNNESSVVTAQFFQEAFMTYTKTNYKDGIPFTAESHYPTTDEWSGLTTNHSENYFHSTYIDNIFTNLIGIIPTLDDRLELRPLVPSNWTYFVIEDLPYHGSLLTFLWDQTGSQYTSFNHSKGLSIYQNGSLIYNQPTLTAFNISLSNATAAIDKLATQPRYDNILVNINSPYGLPSVSADSCFNTNGDTCLYQPWKMNDGLLWYDITPDNFWTNNQSTTPYATITATLPSNRTFSSVSLAILDDSDESGVLRCPAAITITDLRTGLTLAERNPWTGCQPNELNTVLFAAPSTDSSNTTTPIPSSSSNNNATSGHSVTTDKIQITLLSQLKYAIAISEIQIWVPSNSTSSYLNITTNTTSSSQQTYSLSSALLGTLIGSLEGRATGLNCTINPSSSTTSPASVTFHPSCWAEIVLPYLPLSSTAVVDANYRTKRNVTITGSGTGGILIGTNWLESVGNQTVTFSGAREEKTLKLWFEDRGKNWMNLFWQSGEPVVESVVVG